MILNEDKVSLEDLKYFIKKLQALQYDLERAKTEEAQEIIINAFYEMQSISKQAKINKQLEFVANQWPFLGAC